MSKAAPIAGIIFPRCGAVTHPSFTGSQLHNLGDGTFMLCYPSPVQCRRAGMLTSAAARQRYFSDKILHLASWGVRPEQVTFSYNEKV